MLDLSICPVISVRLRKDPPFRPLMFGKIRYYPNTGHGMRFTNTIRQVTGLFKLKFSTSSCHGLPGKSPFSEGAVRNRPAHCADYRLVGTIKVVSLRHKAFSPTNGIPPRSGHSRVHL